MTTPRFALLVPVKEEEPKSRLRPVGDDQRSRLMAAFARDAVTAAAASPLVEVYVVGGVDVAAATGVRLLEDAGDGDLNRALAAAADEIATDDLGVAALVGDLPCLRTGDLELALATVLETGRRGFVADADGTGTTLLAAPPGVPLDPRFGPGSARRHRDSGAVALADKLTDDLASLRLDVDTTADLEAALRFGVGPHTARAAAHLS